MDIEKQRRRLLALKEQLMQRSNEDYRRNIKDYAQELSVVDNHPADVASDDYQRNFDASLAENNQLLLERVEQALARLADGRYRVCCRCGGEISRQRLEALPWAVSCQKCAGRERPAGGISRSFPSQGEFTWPKFQEYGTSDPEAEPPPWPL